MDENAAQVNHELIRACLDRISSGDKDAAFDLAQLYMTRVVQKDVHAMLSVVEGLARQSIALGSTEAKDFLEGDWPQLRQVLERRLNRTFLSDSERT